jgi:uncharacterized phage-associated protein
MPYSALTIAGEFLKIAETNNKKLDPLQLMKLVYLAHGWNLALFDEELVKDPIDAWTYGPVIKSLYQRIKKFGASNITEPIDTDEQITPEEKMLLEKVFEKYGNLSGIQLSSLTHETDSPWAKTWDNGHGKSMTISNNEIKEYFRAQAKTRR